MLLRKHAKKLQLGGSLNQAKNEAAPINVTWKAFDLSGFKPTKLDIPSGAYKGTGSGSGGASDDGLPSDVAYVDSKIEEARSRITSGMSGPTSAEYKDSAQLKADQEELNKWATIRASMLKPRMDNYSKAQTRLAKAKDDLAITGDKALVRDASDNNAVKVVSVQDLVTARFKDGTTVKPKYSTMTIGDAFSVRFQDKAFSGFTEQGAVIDNILDNAVDSSQVDTEMDALFKKAGIISDQGMSFIIGGKTMLIDTLIKDLSTAASSYGTQTIKTASNKDNLITAVELFKQNLSPGHLQALRNKKVAQFNKEYGTNSDVTSDFAAEWIDSQVNAYIADRASIFLRSATGRTGAAKGAPAGTKKAKREFDTNRITMAAFAPGTTVQLESSYNDASDLKESFNLMGTIQASSVNIDDGLTKDITAKQSGLALGNSSFVKRLASNLNNNLFFGDSQSTPVASFNGNTGLETVFVDTSAGTEMKILQGMPYYEEAGVKKIAWEMVGDCVRWGKTYKQLYDARREALDVPWLDDIEKAKIITETNTKTNFDPSKVSGLKTGNIAMIPVVLIDRRRLDDTLENIFSSDVTGKQKQLVEDATRALKMDDVKKTFVFSVMPEGLAGTLPDAFGEEFAIKKPIDLDQFQASAKAQQNNNFNLQDLIAQNAKIVPVKEEETK